MINNTNSSDIYEDFYHIQVDYDGNMYEKNINVTVAILLMFIGPIFLGVWFIFSICSVNYYVRRRRIQNERHRIETNVRFVNSSENPQQGQHGTPV